MSETGKEFGECVKELRQNNYECFKTDVLPLISDSKEVENISEDCFSFAVKTRNHGVIDIYPKANKIHIRKQNKWIKPILPWLRKNIVGKCIS